MKSRTKARGVALQALYEIDSVDHPPEVVWQNRVSDSGIDEKLSEFAHQIIINIYPIRGALDAIIAEHAPEWPLDQVATIDRNIIRIALWEFGVNKKTPIKVAINEAVELAKVFGSDSSARFVNGVLGSLSLRTNEINQLLSTIIKKDQIKIESK